MDMDCKKYKEGTPCHYGIREEFDIRRCGPTVCVLRSCLYCNHSTVTGRDIAYCRKKGVMVGLDMAESLLCEYYLAWVRT